MKEFIGQPSNTTCIHFYLDRYMITGCADGSIKFWDIKKALVIEELIGHTNAVVSFTELQNYLFSGSLDQMIICWDIPDIIRRLKEREAMQYEELISRKFEAYQNYIDSKTKKKKKKKGSKAGPAKKKK